MILWPLCASAQERNFPPDAVVNVALAPYYARPDDAQDDTRALQKAITDNVDSGRVLYFPSGTYDISDTLMAKNGEGIWRARLTLQGQNQSRTILRLADRATGFGDATRPKAVVMTGSHWETGDSLDGGGNKAFFNNVFDLTIDTGRGNAGAVGVDWAVSNQGALKNVTVQSGDEVGVAGVSLKRRIPGPGLLQNLTVKGFNVGVDVGDIQYGLTMENVKVQNQKVAGIRTDKNLLHIRRLISENRVPAILVTGIEGNVILLDSNLSGGVGGLAVESEGNLLVRNVRVEGYQPAAIRCRNHEAVGPVYGQWSWPTANGEVVTSASTPSQTLGLLPIEETPSFWNENLKDWIAVGARREGEKDDTAAIQRAFDAGKGTVYFLNNRIYFLSDTVVVRGKVRQVLGMGSEINLGAASEPFSNRAHPRPLFRIDPTEAQTVFLENIFFNAQYPGEVLIENNSPADLVIKHCAGWVGADGQRRAYRNTAKARGKLFIEDVFLPGWEFRGQSVWARQFNPENWDGDGSIPQVANIGGKLWILGFKTEGAAPFITTSAGGVTELLGAYNYISATKGESVPSDVVPYSIIDATANLSFTTENFRANDYNVYIRQSNGGVSRDVKGTELSPRNGRDSDKSFVAPLYNSKAQK